MSALEHQYNKSDEDHGSPKNNGNIVLLGDSTLDNVVWVPNQESSVTGQLSLLNYHVINLAADGFTTADVLDGAPPLLSRSKRIAVGDPFPDSAFEFLAPLRELAKLNESPEYIALSVGGNDVRHILKNMSQIGSVIPKLLFNYQRIVHEIISIHPSSKLILLTQYRPCAITDIGYYGVYEAMSTLPGPGSSLDKINSLMRMIYSTVFPLARDLRLPVIDLTNSYYMNDESLYECQIEPSAKGSRLTARLIHSAIQDFLKHSKSTDRMDTSSGVPGSGADNNRCNTILPSTFYSAPPSVHSPFLDVDLDLTLLPDLILKTTNDGSTLSWIQAF